MTAKHWIPSVRRTDELNTTLFQAWNHFPLTLSLCQSKITTLWWKQGFYLTVLCDSVAAPGTCVGGSKAFLTSDNFHFAKGDKKKEAGYRWRLDESWRAAITFCRWNLQRARFFSRPDSFVWQFGRSLHISQFFFCFFFCIWFHWAALTLASIQRSSGQLFSISCTDLTSQTGQCAGSLKKLRDDQCVVIQHFKVWVSFTLYVSSQSVLSRKNHHTGQLWKLLITSHVYHK